MNPSLADIAEPPATAEPASIATSSIESNPSTVPVAEPPVSTETVTAEDTPNISNIVPPAHTVALPTFVSPVWFNDPTRDQLSGIPASYTSNWALIEQIRRLPINIHPADHPQLYGLQSLLPATSNPVVATELEATVFESSQTLDPSYSACHQDPQAEEDLGTDREVASQP